MPTAATNIEAKRTQEAALDSYAIRPGRHRDETYTTRTRCSGSGALSEEGPAVRASMSGSGLTVSSRRSFIDCAIRTRGHQFTPKVTAESAPHGSVSERTLRITSCRRGAMLRGLVLRNSSGRTSKTGVAFTVCLGIVSRIAICLPRPGL